MPAAWTKLIAAAEVAAAVRALGARLERDYGGEEIVLVGVLQGGLFFLADLARALGGAVRVDTLLAQSYGDARASSGRVELRQDIRTDIGGRHVLVVDDIFDSGRTLRFVLDHLARRRPRSLEAACLLVKQVPRAAQVTVQYGLLPIPDVFAVGCGLDWAGLGRNLPDVWGLAPGVSEEAARAEFEAQLGGRLEAHDGEA